MTPEPQPHSDRILQCRSEVSPEPNTDRARQAIAEGIGAAPDDEAVDIVLDSLSDAGLWVGAYPEVPPWLAEAPEDCGTHRHDHYCHGVFGCTKSPLYVVTPPEENQ